MKIDNLPDVLTPKQLHSILPIGMNGIYKLLTTQAIKSIKIGRKHIILKQALLDFLQHADYNDKTPIAETVNLCQSEPLEGNFMAYGLEEKGGGAQ